MNAFFGFRERVLRRRYKGHHVRTWHAVLREYLVFARGRVRAGPIDDLNIEEEWHQIGMLHQTGHRGSRRFHGAKARHVDRSRS